LSPRRGRLAEISLKYRERKGSLHALSGRWSLALDLGSLLGLGGFFLHDKAEPLRSRRRWRGLGRRRYGGWLNLIGGALELFFGDASFKAENLRDTSLNPRPYTLCCPNGCPATCERQAKAY
jgi:hypothetical protein